MRRVSRVERRDGKARSATVSVHGLAGSRYSRVPHAATAVHPPRKVHDVTRRRTNDRPLQVYTHDVTFIISISSYLYMHILVLLCNVRFTIISN